MRARHCRSSTNDRTAPDSDLSVVLMTTMKRVARPWGSRRKPEKVSQNIIYVREGYKVRKQKIVWKFPNLWGGVRPRSISKQFLKCVEWSNSSRNAKKIFSIFRGGSPNHLSKNCENFLSILRFSRGKKYFFQSCSECLSQLKLKS